MSLAGRSLKQDRRRCRSSTPHQQGRLLPPGTARSNIHLAVEEPHHTRANCSPPPYSYACLLAHVRRDTPPSQPTYNLKAVIVLVLNLGARLSHCALSSANLQARRASSDDKGHKRSNGFMS
ncbi:hypothetical protein EJB05_23304, partial [Eragrostis curvula]